uniref:TLC domain-containing protein n=1 Tax=Globisporangium ultimum (strain ATCC 200006 / CBS 805.95 / DAOM BR144) TaxID=431595 RepID=K3WHE8_GLOUD
MLAAAMESSSVELLPEEKHVRLGENALVASLTFVFFWATFGLAWVVSKKYVKEFAAFPAPQKADWCSRVNSTIHAVAVVIGVAVALSSITWDSEFAPTSSIRSASFIFSVAIGYFMCDLMIIIIWPVPMQYVFITHHIVAVVPYFINNFISCCAASQYGLLLYLLVELATLPLNARGFMESVGREDTKNHTRSIYVTYWVWAVTRTALPIYLLYVVWKYAYPSDRNHDVCLYTNIVGAHVISLFCVGVFLFVHTPEILALRKARAKAREDALQGGGNSEDEDGAAVDPPKSCVNSLTISLSRRNKETMVDDSYDDVELGVLPRSARAS